MKPCHNPKRGVVRATVRHDPIKGGRNCIEIASPHRKANVNSEEKL